MNIHIISRNEARHLLPHWPADVSYSEEFSNFHTLRYGLQSGYIWATADDHGLLMPIQWGDGIAHSVHKGHTTPCILGAGFPVIEWHEMAHAVRCLTQSRLYIADLAIPETMARGLSPLPSAQHILLTDGHDIETMFSRFHETTRKRVRRAWRQNYRTELITGRMPRNYYDLYVHHQFEKGTPPRAIEYFNDTAHAFGDGFLLWGAYMNGQLVGMNLGWCADHSIWLSINASQDAYAQKNVNYLLYYETIKWACEHAVERIDFGGSSTQDGHIHNSFKIRLGASMMPIYRLRDGTLAARMFDMIARKKRALHIRFNKMHNLWRRKS